MPDLPSLDLKLDDPPPAPPPGGKKGVDRIAAERFRQVEALGWTSEHDARHIHGELRMAAKAYASDPTAGSAPPAYWPWEATAWKPSADPVWNWVRAGALLAAEIDRLVALRDTVMTPIRVV